MIQPTPVPIAGNKPRLLYFQFGYDDRLPRFLLIHKEEHVRVLEQTFDVVVISHDCDYDAVCAAHQPDLTLFESGVPTPLCRRLKIANTHTHPHVPKIGMLHADAFCQGRAGFISDMYEWGIETFFTIATAALDFNRELEGRLFFWPNSIDPAVYRDYGETKTIEVLFTGNTSSLYPWRQKLLNIVPTRYSSTIKAHPGYTPSAQAARVPVGETYARLINSAFFVPSCGTVAREIVRKHFEIPGCNSCLITERTATVEEAGYEDMVNCVFADEQTVLDKLDSLFRDPDKLLQITRAGHALVHSRHTMAQRNQIREWFELNRGISPQEGIAQSGPFAPLRRVERELVRFSEPSTRPQLDLLAQGDACFERDDYPAARQFYQQCSRFVDYMPEPHVRIAECELQLGNAAEALSRVTRPLEFSLGAYDARDPDPVEWSLYILCLLCLGRRSEAARNAGTFDHVDHLALRRIRWLTAFLSRDAKVPESIPGDVLDADRPTIHRLRPLSTRQWIARTASALTANGRSEWAQALSRATREDDGVADVRPSAAGSPLAPPPRRAPVDAGVRETHAAVRRHFARRGRRRLAKRVAIDTLRGWLHRLESRLGYFLPYRHSSIRQTKFFGRLQDAFNDATVSAAIAITRGIKDKYVQGFQQAADASTKAAELHTLASWQAGADAQRKYDLAMIDCATPATRDELARAITTFAKTSQYLFLVNCQVLEAGRVGAFVGDQFEQVAAMSGAGARGEHLAFCRVSTDRRSNHAAVAAADQVDAAGLQVDSASARPARTTVRMAAGQQVPGIASLVPTAKP